MDISAIIKEWINEGLKKPGKSGADLARFAGVSPSAITKWKQLGQIDKDKLPKVAEYLEEDIPIFFYKTSNPPIKERIVAIPQYRNNTLSAGVGSIAMSEIPDSEMYFKRSWLVSKGWNVDDLFVIYIKGESMQPRLHSGDVVLIHKGVNKIQADGVYALNVLGDLKIKRLNVKLDGTVVIKSDNPEYEDDVYSSETAQNISVLGRCVWVGSEFF